MTILHSKLNLWISLGFFLGVIGCTSSNQLSLVDAKKILLNSVRFDTASQILEPIDAEINLANNPQGGNAFANGRLQFKFKQETYKNVRTFSLPNSKQVFIADLVHREGDLISCPFDVEYQLTSSGWEISKSKYGISSHEIGLFDILKSKNYYKYGTPEGDKLIELIGDYNKTIESVKKDSLYLKRYSDAQQTLNGDQPLKIHSWSSWGWMSLQWFESLGPDTLGIITKAEHENACRMHSAMEDPDGKVQAFEKKEIISKAIRSLLEIQILVKNRLELQKKHLSDLTLKLNDY